MLIGDIIWLPEVVDKLSSKHRLSVEEVEELLYGNPVFRKVQKGHVRGEDLYAALGQVESGRYLIVFFIYKRGREGLVITARDMDEKERKYYAQQKGN
jgi:hypothetical protein